MNEEILNKFIDIVAEDIYLLQEDSTPERIEKYLIQIKSATMIYMIENSCGCYILDDELRKYREYIQTLTDNFWRDE